MVLTEHVVPLGHLDRPVHMVQLDVPDHQVLLAQKESKEQKDHQERKDNNLLLDHQVVPVLMEDGEQLENQANRDQQDLKEEPVTEERQVSSEVLDQWELWEHEVLQVELEYRDQ